MQISKDLSSFRKLELKEHSKPYLIFNGLMKNPYFLVAPAVIIAIITTIYSMVFCIVLAFCEWDLLGGSMKFVGLKNFKFIFTSADFILALRNTVIYMVVIVLASTVLKVAAAIFLNKNTSRHNLVQTIMFTPHIIASVAITTIWKFLMIPEGGVLNMVIELFGGEGIGWYMSADWSLFSLILIALWSGMGYGVLLIIAGLRSIPGYVYEAARLDRSRGFHCFWHITMPLLSPTLFYVIFTTMVGTFGSFDMVDQLTSGGPKNSSTLIAFYIYRQGLRFMHYGRAMAAAVILLIITSTLAVINFAIGNKKVHYQ